MSEIRKAIKQVDLNSLRGKKDIFDEITDLLKKDGYDLTEIDSNRPWGGYIRMNDSNAEKFVGDFFDNLDIETARLGNPDLPLSPKILVIAPRQRISWQYHHRRAERWHFLNDGAYHLSKDDNQGEKINSNAGDEVQINTGERHRGVGHSEKYTLVAEIWQHTNLNQQSNEDDIVRLQDDYTNR